jgi:hypothetical protein
MRSSRVDKVTGEVTTLNYLGNFDLFDAMTDVSDPMPTDGRDLWWTAAEDLGAMTRADDPTA